jgi:hypothetical protein
MLRKFVFVGLLLGVFSCGSEDADPIRDFSISEQSTINIKESDFGVIKVLSKSAENFTFELEQNPSESIYITHIKGSEVHFIAPNVNSNKKITFKVNIKNTQGYVGSLDGEINIENRIIEPQNIPPKPNVFSNTNIAKHDSKVLDPVGVPLYVKNGESYYYPVSVAQYAYDLYSHYNRFQTQETLDKFLVVAAWLRDNCVYTQYGFCSYRSDFSIDAYKLTTDWITAMGQGQAISSLIAAHYLTGDDSYAEVAYDAVSAFLYPISVKGMTADFDGVVWYEEYGSEEMPAHVLNGFLFALSGLHHFNQVYAESFSSYVFNTGVDSLAKNIKLYDFDFTTRYDYSPLQQLASTKGGPDIYHEIHIYQLAWLYSVTGNTEIKAATHQFLKQDMGGIQSFYTALKQQSKEIKSVVASHSIDSVNYGTDKLSDANWTWFKYWSSHRPVVDMLVELNEDILQTGVLEKIVLTAVNKSDLPRSFDVYLMCIR